MAGDLLDLLGLLVDNLRDAGEVVIDQLLVSLVDEWAEEESRGGDEGKTPERHDFDKEIGEEGAEESLWYVRRSIKPTGGQTYSSRY